MDILLWAKCGWIQAEKELLKCDHSAVGAMGHWTQLCPLFKMQHLVVASHSGLLRLPCLEKLVSMPFLLWMPSYMVGELQSEMVVLDRSFCTLILSSWYWKLMFKSAVFEPDKLSAAAVIRFFVSHNLYMGRKRTFMLISHNLKTTDYSNICQRMFKHQVNKGQTVMDDL